MLQVGSIVKVKQNAYEGSDDPNDFEVRGKIGEIVEDTGDDTWKVRVEDEWYPLKGDELEEIEQGADDNSVIVKKPEALPVIVCLCGSTRFYKAFHDANFNETLAGKIVLTIGCDTRSDGDLFASTEQVTEIKSRLDTLHLRKIDLADEVLILNVGGYIGESTRRELEYAREHGKRIRFLEPEKELA